MRYALIIIFLLRKRQYIVIDWLMGQMLWFLGLSVGIISGKLLSLISHFHSFRLLHFNTFMLSHFILFYKFLTFTVSHFLYVMSEHVRTSCLKVYDYCCYLTIMRLLIKSMTLTKIWCGGVVDDNSCRYVCFVFVSILHLSICGWLDFVAADRASQCNLPWVRARPWKAWKISVNTLSRTFTT